MSRFNKKYLAKLEQMNILLILYKRYVDDLNMALRVKKVREGQEGEHLDRKTAKVLREVANNIMPKSIVGHGHVGERQDNSPRALCQINGQQGCSDG